jgi:hypothetical protein
VLSLFPLVKENMKRLTLDELKAQKNQKNVVAQLEAIKGGLADGCHYMLTGQVILRPYTGGCHTK